MKNLLLLTLTLLFLFSCNSREFPKVKSIETTPNTNFLATLDEKTDFSKTQIYCSTLLYAWGEIKTEFNNEITISDSFPNLITLNNSERHKNSLADDEIETSISVEYPQISAKAFFNKSLPFEYKFEKNSHDLKFNDTTVQSFGTSGNDDHEITDQIDILFYENDTEFGLKLKPEDKKHEIFFYLPQNNKSKTLEQLTNSFFEKVKTNSELEKTEKNEWKYHFLHEDILSIPSFKFNLEKDYTTLGGNNFNANDKQYLINKAYQRIALILDEKGAEVESEAIIEACTEAIDMEELPKPKKLLIDKPFLLIFKRVDTENPYLVLWVDNTELMTVN